MKRLFTEPLFQFFLLGLALFIGHGLWAKHVTKADYTIEVAAAEIKRQAEIFAAENRRQPTDEDVQALLFAHVEEQVLMREAERLGLAEDDTIIRRRLAQKMRFMIEDSTPPPAPKPGELETWFKDNKAEFYEPDRISFSHVYFSPQTHGATIEDVATENALVITDENWERMGDPFILKRRYTDQSATEITREFGSRFAKDIQFLKPGIWQGPVESAYGLHLVRLDNVIRGSEAEFETVKESVLRQWQITQKRSANQKRLEDLLKKYKVEVEDVRE